MYPGLADVDNQGTLVDGAYGVAVEVHGGCGHDFVGIVRQSIVVVVEGSQAAS